MALVALLSTGALQTAPLAPDGSSRASGAWDRNALLSGYQNPAEICAREVLCPDLPADLVGTYYRNMHARFTGWSGRKVRHPFDADGMVTGVTLDGRSGKAVVRQRFVATDGAVAERVAGRTLFPGQFGNPQPLWAGGASFKNLANTNVLWNSGKLLALWEGSRPHIIDPLSLATRGEWNVNGLVGGGPTDSFAAHPRRSADGGVANFAYAGNPVTGKTTVRFWDFLPDSWELRSPAQVHQVEGFGLYHDWLLTENWFILVAAPATWGPAGKPLDQLRMTAEFVAGRRPVTSMISFDKTRPTMVHLYPRDAAAAARAGRRAISVELDTFFSFHHANAWEDEASGTLTFDTVSTPELKVDDSSLLGQGNEGAERALGGGGNRFLIEDLDYERDVPRTDLVRYTVDLRRRTFSKRPLSTRHVEFPSVAAAVSGRPHRYVYSTPGPSAAGVSPQAGVLKTDTVDASRSQIWLPREYEFCGEVIFTPRPEPQSEDDGYLLTLCYNGREGTSTMLAFDARGVDAGPIARVPLTTEADGDALPADAAIAGPGHGLHATFVPGLAPTLREVQDAETRRGQTDARFLSDAPRTQRSEM